MKKTMLGSWPSLLHIRAEQRDTAVVFDQDKIGVDGGGAAEKEI